MAAPFRHVVSASSLYFRPFYKHLRVVTSLKHFHTTGCQQLLSSDSLGLEDFKKARYEIRESIGDQKDRFRAMMEDYMNSSDKGTVFTTDLKTIVHISETEDELESLEAMLKQLSVVIIGGSKRGKSPKYHKQSSNLRFSTFNFGPVVMRLLHVIKKPYLAYKFFTDKELEGFFDQMSSYIILMDLLFEAQRYMDVLNVYDIVCERMLDGVRYPHDAVLVATAACLRLNTTESYTRCMKMVNAVKPENLSQRALVFATILAVQQNEKKKAEELVTYCRNKPGTGFIIDNIETLVWIKCGKIEEAVNLWKEKLNTDEPESETTPKNKYLFTEIAEQLTAAVTETEDLALQRQLQLVMKGLKEQGLLQDVQLMEFVFRPLVRRRQLQDGYKQRRRSAVAPGQRSQPRGKTTYHKQKLQWPEGAT